MKILLDLSCLDNQNLSGIGTYVKNLAGALDQLNGLEIYGSWKLSRWKKQHWIRHHCQLPKKIYIPGISGLTLQKYSLFHGPDFKIPNTQKIKKVVNVHDLAVFEQSISDPESAQRKQHLFQRHIIKRHPDAIITPSEFTRQRLLLRFPELKGITHTTYYGADHFKISTYDFPKIYDFPYLLFVGNVERRKNIVGLIRAFEIVNCQEHCKDLHLVIVGKNGFAWEEVQGVIDNSPARESIIRPGYISDTNLKGLFQHASAFVYPSFYEGFGFPILEAMYLNCPVVTSLGSSTEEIAGKAALLVDPYDHEQLAYEIERILSDNTLRKHIIKQGMARAQTFSWERCATETNAVYQRIV